MLSGAGLRVLDADTVEIVRRADKTQDEGLANDDNSSTSLQICLVSHHNNSGRQITRSKCVCINSNGMS